MRDYFAALAARTVQPDMGLQPRRRVRWEAAPEPTLEAFGDVVPDASRDHSRQIDPVERDRPRRPTPRLHGDASLPESEAGTPGSRRRRSAPARAINDGARLAESAASPPPFAAPAPRRAAPSRSEPVGAGTVPLRSNKGREKTDGGGADAAAARTAERALHVPARISVRGREREASEPVVRIHIGRVDVRAVAAAAPAPSVPRAGKRALMSLDEYVQKRDRDAS